MARVVIFGIQDFASLAHFYLKHDSPHDVVGFSVTQEYLPGEPTFEGLPIVAAEEVDDVMPPTEFSFFVPISHRRMNRNRQTVYADLKERGYRFINYISSRATVFPETQIGENCFILEDNTIQPFVSIGNNVVLWSGNHIGHHGVIKDHVMLTSQVVLSGRCVVEPYSFFGVNSTIRDGLHISEGTFVAMGACVTRDTDPWSIYRGNPAVKLKRSSRDLDL